MVIDIRIFNKRKLCKLLCSRVLKALLCTCTLLSAFSSYGQNNVTALMALYAEEGQHNRIESPFNGVMLVAKNGKVLLKKAYGFSNKEESSQLTTNSRFLIGSVTKQFTAMLVLQQVEEGTIDLDKTINDYLPYYPKEKGTELTIHRLLSHTSGLPHYEGLRRLNISLDKFREDEISAKSYAQLISRMKFINKPGTQFYYSSMNYVLLGAILEQVSGQSFSHLIEEKIAQPLKLKNTGFADNKYINRYVAKGYTFKEGGFFEALLFDKKGEYKEGRFRHQSTAFSTGGMHSTIDDLYLWSQAIKQYKILSKKMTDKMFSPNLGGYGYGWYVNHENMLRFNPSIQLISHGGSLEGYSSNVALYKDGTTVIYLANVAPVGSIRLTMNMHLAAQNIEVDEFVRDIKFPNVHDGLTGFLEDGGIPALRAYFQELSSRAGYKMIMIEWGYQELIKLYLNAGDLGQAEVFFNEMLSNYHTPSKKWMNQVGYDFLEADAFELAIKSFKINKLNHQYSASAFDSLGDAYRDSGQYKLAKQNYQQAVKLAKHNQSKHVSYYQEQLASVTTLAGK